MDLFSTNYLMGVVQDLKVPPSWALGRYFTRQVTDESEEIHFDIVDRKRRVAPFVSPYAPGKLIDAAARKVSTFKPAYIKDKRPFDINRPFKRAVGETIGGNLSAQQRQQLAIVEELNDQLTMLDRRLELMSMEALRTGKVVITGEGYPSVTVDFGRDAALTGANLAGTARWDDAGTVADPLADLTTWALLSMQKSGVYPRDVVMATDTFRVFVNHAKVKDKWAAANARMQGSLVSGAPLTEGAVYMGSLEGFDFFVYAGWYVDPADDTEKESFPAKSLMLASAGIEGVRAFGAIKDQESLQAVPFFPKSWTEPDPSIRYLMLQSAPLMVPTRPNATYYRKVLS